jgi:triosephosphate isomerase
VSSRRPLVAANWKMNFVRSEVRQWVSGWAEAWARSESSAAAARTEVRIYPGPALLETAGRELEGLNIAWGGQDVHAEAKGAFTGDVSAIQLRDLGATSCLCGHSERRRDHAETDLLVGRKARTAGEAGLAPLVCLGETLAERRSGHTFDVLTRQLEGLLAHDPALFDLAYEPVWAIGTGETATVAIAQEAHGFLRQALVSRLGSERAGATRILYGGSATPDNAPELFAAEDIDGFLVGGASLDPSKFLGIVRVCG